MQYDVFRSKRFWTAVLGITSMVLVAFVPELEQHVETLVPGILGIIGLLIGGYTLQDTALAYNGESKYLNDENPTQPQSNSLSVEAVG